jgi:Acetyltransferase (GNAT) domain
MGYRGMVLHTPEIDASFAAAWDSLPEGRGLQADFYDSHAWFTSWLASAPEQSPNTRVVTVLDGDRPVAAMPFVASGHDWCVAGAEVRTRTRPAVGTENPDPEALTGLAEMLAESGARKLTLHRLPSQDPATSVFIESLRMAGYHVEAREYSCDHLAFVEGGWPEHSSRFHSFAKYVKRFTGRITPYWSLTIDEYGTSPQRPVDAGFSIYRDVHARSWKGSLAPALAVQRSDLLRRAEQRRWARLYVLNVANQPVAVHIWFRIGDVATWLSTAYDKDLAVLSPGTIVQWWSQEQLFKDTPPGLVDLLPGDNPQKERLAPETPALLVVDAVRRTAVSGVTFPAQLQIRRVRKAALQRAQAKLISRRARPPAATGTRIRRIDLPPVAEGQTATATPLQPDNALLRYLAVAAGVPNVQELTAGWSDGDEWWRVGELPSVLLRVSGTCEVREFVDLDGQLSLAEASRAVAAVTDRTLVAYLADPSGTTGSPTTIHVMRLPWPGAWRDASQHPAGTASS